MRKYFFLTSLIFICCKSATQKSNVASENISTDSSSVVTKSITDSALFDLVQKQTFQYFWDGAEPTSGLARERFHADNVYPENDKSTVTSGGSGFGIMSILVGIKRGFITREEGMQRLEKVLHF